MERRFLSFLFFFLLIPQGVLFCALEDDFYNKIQLSSGDIHTREQYLRKYADELKTEGFLLKEERGTPILESYICGKYARDYGIFFFFKDKKLCSKGVSFFPGKKAVVVKKLPVNYTLTGKWTLQEGPEFSLIYRSDVEFKENSTDDGFEFTEKPDHMFLSNIGKPLFPKFVFRGKKWEQVLPLREMYSMKIDPQGFIIEVFTDSEMPYDIEKLKKVLGVKAEKVTLDSTRPNSFILKGTGLLGAKIPFFQKNYQSDEESRGRYILRLNYPKKRKIEDVSLKFESSEINYKSGESGSFLEIIIRENRISDDELKKIVEFVTGKIPSFYIKD